MYIQRHKPLPQPVYHQADTGKGNPCGEKLNQSDLEEKILIEQEKLEKMGELDSNAIPLISMEKKYSNISSGNYTIAMKTNTQYEFIDLDPSISPAVLAPDSDSTYVIRVADKNINALFLEVKDSDTSHAPIAGAKVTLKDGGTDIFTEKQSSLNGVVFYPDGATPLDNNDYTLEIDADGYGAYSQSVSIDKLTHVEVELTRN